MPLVGARSTERSAFTSTFQAFQAVNQTSSASASTSTGMTAGSGGSGRAKRAGAGARGSGTPPSGAVSKPTARGGRAAAANQGGFGMGYVGRNSMHIPHGNTALSVKADEERLNTITDEKERKRLKRLLRNRVSAQQARERKKAYLASLEQTEAQKANRLHELENRVTTLERENQMLRQVIQTVTRRAVPPNASDFQVPAM